MRTALLITGFLRCQQHTYKSYITNVIKPNNADVFLSTWDISDVIRPELGSTDAKPVDINIFTSLYGDNLSDYIVRCYDLVQRSLPNIEEQTSRTYDCFKTNSRAIKHGIVWANRIISMWYLIAEGIRLIRNYEERTGVRYDVIFKSRTDIMLNSQIVFEGRLDTQTIYGDQHFYNWDGNPNAQLCSDIFFGDRDSFRNLEELYLYSQSMYLLHNLDVSNAENLFYSYCIHKALAIQKLPLPYSRVKPSQFKGISS